jgi:hypothetical protein
MNAGEEERTKGGLLERATKVVKVGLIITLTSETAIGRVALSVVMVIKEGVGSIELLSLHLDGVVAGLVKDNLESVVQHVIGSLNTEVKLVLRDFTTKELVRNFNGSVVVVKAHIITLDVAVAITRQRTFTSNNVINVVAESDISRSGV